MRGARKCAGGGRAHQIPHDSSSLSRWPSVSSGGAALAPALDEAADGANGGVATTTTTTKTANSTAAALLNGAETRDDGGAVLSEEGYLNLRTWQQGISASRDESSYSEWLQYHKRRRTAR